MTCPTWWLAWARWTARPRQINPPSHSEPVSKAPKRPETSAKNGMAILGCQDTRFPCYRCLAWSDGPAKPRSEGACRTWWLASARWTARPRQINQPSHPEPVSKAPKRPETSVKNGHPPAATNFEIACRTWWLAQNCWKARPRPVIHPCDHHLRRRLPEMMTFLRFLKSTLRINPSLRRPPFSTAPAGCDDLICWKARPGPTSHLGTSPSNGACRTWWRAS